MVQFYKKIEKVRKLDRNKNAKKRNDHIQMKNMQQSDISAKAFFKVQTKSCIQTTKKLKQSPHQKKAKSVFFPSNFRVFMFMFLFLCVILDKDFFLKYWTVVSSSFVCAHFVFCPS